MSSPRLARFLRSSLSRPPTPEARVTGRPTRSRPVEPTFTRPNSDEEQFAMIWTTPAYEDLRLGFEINLYINNR
ncbi:pyrroloquinoline quinone precursor peptide PqqA [Thiocapsa rosea]|uniref:pyrroloquinoline quinone precursor peptide PqqA n=1 Tax=Thiocapsa rosea TaxID=69360 RepID=UPI003CCC55CA